MTSPQTLSKERGGKLIIFRTALNYNQVTINKNYLQEKRLLKNVMKVKKLLS